MTNESKPYWFPAKRYGWGWGPPICWQGWVVIGVFIVALAACARLFLPRRHPLEFTACVIVLTAALTIVMWAKGEPPQWRWGDKKER